LLAKKKSFIGSATTELCIQFFFATIGLKDRLSLGEKRFALNYGQMH